MAVIQKERPKEKPQVGDLVIRRTLNLEYYPAKLVGLKWKGRGKLIAELDYSNRGFRSTTRCNYLQLTKIRKDYWWESISYSVLKLFKKKEPWATVHRM